MTQVKKRNRRLKSPTAAVPEATAAAPTSAPTSAPAPVVTSAPVEAPSPVPASEPAPAAILPVPQDPIPAPAPAIPAPVAEPTPVLPTVEPVQPVKAWYTSRTVWGGIVAAVSFGFLVTGRSIAPEMQNIMVETLVGVAGGVASLISIWGRLAATHRIG